MDCFPRRRFLQAVGASMVGGLAVAPVLSALGETASTKTRFGWQPTLNGARYFIAHDEGLFAKNGIEVEQIKFLAGPPFFAAFQSRSIDVGFMGTPPASVGIAQGVPMKIFAVENYAFGSEGLIVTAKSGINSLKDLRGKRIAAQRGTSGEYGLITGLKSVGMTLKDIEYLTLDVTALLPAFTNGDIDGGWYWEPWQGEMLEAGGKQIITDGEVGVAGCIVWVARPEWLASNGDVVQRILRTLDEAHASLMRNPKQAAEDLHNDMGVSSGLALEVLTKEAKWPTMKEEWDPNYVASINPSAIKDKKGLVAILDKLAQYQYQVRAIDAVPDFAAAIDPSFVAKYVSER
jgi:taurine transport system substrate-binding protein